MIWLILALLPIVLMLAWVAKESLEVFLVILIGMPLIAGWLLLLFYGLWSVGEIEHCGDFWQSLECS